MKYGWKLRKSPAASCPLWFSPHFGQWINSILNTLYRTEHLTLSSKPNFQKCGIICFWFYDLTWAMQQGVHFNTLYDDEVSAGGDWFMCHSWSNPELHDTNRRCLIALTRSSRTCSINHTWLANRRGHEASSVGSTALELSHSHTLFTQPPTPEAPKMSVRHLKSTRGEGRWGGSKLEKEHGTKRRNRGRSGATKMEIKCRTDAVDETADMETGTR